MSLLCLSCIHNPPGPISDPDELGGIQESCLPQTRIACAEDGDLYWFNSCGERGALSERCPSGGPCAEGPPPQCTTPDTSCLKLSGTRLEEDIESREMTLDFGEVPVDGSRAVELTLESCGGEPLTISRVEYATQNAFTADMPMTPLTLTPSGEPASTETLTVTFTPSEARQYRDQLIIYSDDPTVPTRLINLTGIGELDLCPRPEVAQSSLIIDPLSVITLDASPSRASDGSSAGLRYEWVVVSRPDGSVAQLVESFYNEGQPANGGELDDPNTPQVRFFVDLVGVYTFRLVVTGALGVSAPSAECPRDDVEVSVQSRTDQAILIELTWNTPADDDQSDDSGTDLDLHFAHPEATFWGDEIWDCHYANESPNWGDSGPQDNPSLDIDDINGAGPENININNPEYTDDLGYPYTIGVHYYSAESPASETNPTGEFGPSDAMIRVYLSGVLKGTYRRRLTSSGEFWVVSAVHWTRNRTWIEEVDRYYNDILDAVP